MNRFEGRVAFITGGGHGIGRATGERLAGEGGRVVVADIDIVAATAVAREFGERAIAVKCDVTDPVSVATAMAAGAAAWNGIDILVNTAGGGRHEGSILNATDEQWHALIDLNLLSVFRCIREAVPHLLESRFGGAIVSISSVNGIAAFGGLAYSAAKAGLELLTRNIAAEFGPRGVRANVVAPGTIDTRVWASQPGSKERLSRLYPLGRIGTPGDVAAAVAFLASDDAAWITGVTLPVDGGVLAGPNAIIARQGE